MKKFGSLRWILLTAGLVAILGLTGMNVYSLYALHENTIESDRENKKLQIDEFADKIRYRFYKPFAGLSTGDIERLEEIYAQTGQFTKEVSKYVKKAANDSIYEAVYFTAGNSDICRTGKPIQRYDREQNQFVPETNYGEIVCDGVGIARTQMKSLIEDYRFNNKVIFDTHRSMTLVLINPSTRTVFGYITSVIDREHLVDDYLMPELTEKFGDIDQSGVHVWLRDWTKNEIIASSNQDVAYDHDKIQFKQTFSDFFDYWKLEVSFTKTPSITASNASLIKNFIVLGAAFLLLSGALVFMFISAQNERALAQRQAGFLANVTHELKTPLALMQAAGENLADGRVTDRNRLKSYGSHIYNEAIRLRKMIEKLLDVAKSDAGQSLVEPKPVYVNQLVESYLEDHKAYIENKGFEIEKNIHEDLPMIMVDIESFETILGNLVDNAVKYSPDTKYLGITLSHIKNSVVLKIEDKGIGISKKSIKQIFDKFYRVEDAMTAKTKGHGLGLSIVENLVKLNGGTIEVKSEKGEGSVFIVAFPVMVESPKEAVAADEKIFRPDELQSKSITEKTPNYVG